MAINSLANFDGSISIYNKSVTYIFNIFIRDINMDMDILLMDCSLKKKMFYWIIKLMFW
jgi:hypothetical protein